MADYTPPLDDIQFLLNDVFKLPEQWAANPVLAERVDGEMAAAMMNEAGKLTSQMIAPGFREADESGCKFDNGIVTAAPGHKEAYQAIIEGGWGGLAGNPDFGGMGMPKALSIFFDEMSSSSDLSFSLFTMLTAGACLSIEQHGSEELKEKYLPKMYTGEWSGSMCLTESHAGSDLGIIRTKAVPTSEGKYAITGTKIFITGGEHDLAENIIHLVLAKLPDAPAGPKGISLFLVPKFFDDGSQNKVSCGSVEHKMGIKASPTCVMNFDGAEGYLVGEESRGLMAMFTMMNYERVGVGVQGIGAAERSYQCAAEYARDRLQGRSAGSSNGPDKPESILVHADVRRMLLTMRAFTEGSRCFATYAANQLDINKYDDDAEAKKLAADKIALLTPVVKSFCTDRGFESCVLGQQVLGGHGFIREWGQEQLVRDVRITQIYEGTNGIQAMDLLGRKVLPNQGATVTVMVEEIKSFTANNDMPESMSTALNKAADSLQDVTQYILDNASSDLVGASAMYYLDLMGYVLYGYMWAQMSVAAKGDSTFLKTKRTVAEFYFGNLLTRVDSLRQSIECDHSAMLAMDEAAF